MMGVRVSRLVSCIPVLCIALASGPAPAESIPVQVVKTSPAYGEEITRLTDPVVLIQFSREMDPSMGEDFLMDQRGAVDENGDPVEIQGELTWPDGRTLRFRPKSPLKPNATYQVSLFSVRSKEGDEMPGAPFRLVFTTGPGASPD